MKTDSMKQVQKRIILRYFGRFALYSAVFSASIVVLLLLSANLAYAGIPVISNIVRFVGRILLQDIFAYNELLLLIAVWILGEFVILFVQWRRFAIEFSKLVEVINQMARRDATPIELPKGMEEIQLAVQQAQLEMQRVEDAAHEAEQRKNDLVVYLAHDLKTPLTSVLGYLTLLRDEEDISPELQHKYLGIATTKAQRLEDLINEFFEITRFNLKGLQLEPTHFNLSRLLEQVNDEFRPLYEEKGLEAKLDIQPDIQLVADAGKIERVVDNLLRNAVNYSWKDTAIEISAAVEDKTVTLVVQNQGDTIPEHKLTHIFEQFYRLDNARSSEGGAGLGLAIAREIVEKHGGGITAESADDTIRFTMRLPLTPL